MDRHKLCTCAREIFLEQENISRINSRLKLTGCRKNTEDMLADWYDLFMKQKRIEASKIDNSITWVDYMTEEFIKQYRGKHFLETEEVPYVPWADYTVTSKNSAIIKQTRSDGKYPKLKLESVIEDSRDENGNIVIHNAWKPVKIFMPARPWRHPGANGPVSKLLQIRQQNTGMRLIDKEDTGTLYTRELLSRPHPKHDMKPYFINEDRRTLIASRGLSAPEYLW